MTNASNPTGAPTGTAGYDAVAVIESPVPGHTDAELAAELRAEPPTPRVVGVLTKALLALALVSVGMVGGVLLQQHVGSSGGTSSGTSPGLGGGLGGAGFPGVDGGPPAGFQPPTGGGGAPPAAGG